MNVVILVPAVELPKEKNIKKKKKNEPPLTKNIISNLKNMKKVKNTKTKKQVIVVPTSQPVKSEIKARFAGQETTRTAKTKKTLIKPRSIRSKENTVAYYNCLIDKIANPASQKTKITQLTHNCKCSKGEVAKAQAAHKQQLIQKLAQSYKAFGESLGHYLHADIVGCAKQLKNK
jgi:hypothetical protein